MLSTAVAQSSKHLRNTHHNSALGKLWLHSLLTTLPTKGLRGWLMVPQLVPPLGAPVRLTFVLRSYAALWIWLLLVLSCYRIEGNFWGRKLSQIGEKMIFVDKTFVDCSFLPRQRTPRPKFHGENFRVQPQNREIRKSFLPRKVFRYTVSFFLYTVYHLEDCEISKVWVHFHLPLACENTTPTHKITHDTLMLLWIAQT